MDSKRALDVSLGIGLLIPAMLVVAGSCMLVIATSGWPPLIVQTRVGADLRPIRVWKLRTMKRGVPVVAKSALDTRGVYTPLGPWLRRTSLDELPQIWNVLRGDMSLVGPRPALPSQDDLLALRRASGVQLLRPGITGLAQILGRENLTLATKVRCEALYARRRSLGLDIKIIIWTVRAVTRGRGAY